LGQTDIYYVAVTGGQPAKLTSVDMGVGAFSMSPDGKQVAFYASDKQAGKFLHAAGPLGDGPGPGREAKEPYR
jgi:hypothetical protein